MRQRLWLALKKNWEKILRFYSILMRKYDKSRRKKNSFDDDGDENGNWEEIKE